MSKSLLFLVGMVMLTWLAYMTWLTGYRAGYDEGSATAWDTARTNLAPHLMTHAAGSHETAEVEFLPSPE